jgi:large subunit ribosomal protein LX
MLMKAFRVSGRFQMGMNELPFEKEFALADRKLAEEKLYAELGSKHRVKRREIKIEKVEEITPDKIQDTCVRMAVTGK